jgi:tol-pal system protein YbgF
MLKRSLFVAVLLASAALPAQSQDIATRILQMEQRINQLTGQVEELNHTVQQLQQRQGQQQGAVSEDVAPAPALRKKPVEQAAAVGAESGIETIEDLPATAPKVQKQVEIIGSGTDGAFEVAPGEKNLAEGGNAAAQTGDGGFDGQVVVPQDGVDQQTAAATDVGQAVVTDGVAQQDGIEQVSLQPEESPDTMYKSANEALLRRQFPEAEAGFRTFLTKYPEHSLAGSAQYWLGETFFVQGDSRQAAQNFLEAYKKYPKSRRAPDSLLKLGMSLNKMGQKEQACAALGSVGTEFPRAVEAKKRATSEYKRAGC